MVQSLLTMLEFNVGKTDFEKLLKGQDICHKDIRSTNLKSFSHSEIKKWKTLCSQTVPWYNKRTKWSC